MIVEERGILLSHKIGYGFMNSGPNGKYVGLYIGVKYIYI